MLSLFRKCNEKFTIKIVFPPEEELGKEDLLRLRDLFASDLFRLYEKKVLMPALRVNLLSLAEGDSAPTTVAKTQGGIEAIKNLIARHKFIWDEAVGILESASPSQS